MLINPTVLKAEEVRRTEPALLAEWSSTLRISSAQEVSGGSGHHHPDDGAFPRGTPQAGRAHVHVHRVGFSMSSLQPSLLCGALPPLSHHQHPVCPGMGSGPIVRSSCHTVASRY